MAELKIDLTTRKISEFQHTFRLAQAIELQSPRLECYMEYKLNNRGIDLVIYDKYTNIIKAFIEAKNRRGRTNTTIGKREQITLLTQAVEGVAPLIIVIYDKNGVNYQLEAQKIISQIC